MSSLKDFLQRSQLGTGERCSIPARFFASAGRGLMVLSNRRRRRRGRRRRQAALPLPVLVRFAFVCSTLTITQGHR